MIKRLFLTMVLVLVLTLEPFAQSIYTYVLNYNDQPTCLWDAVSNATYYEIRLIGIKVNGQEVVFPSEQITAVQKQLTRPHTGTFKVQVRACNTICSEWSNSIDPLHATVNGQPMGWKLYWKVPPPTIIGLWNKLKMYLNGDENNG